MNRGTQSTSNRPDQTALRTTTTPTTYTGTTRAILGRMYRGGGVIAQLESGGSITNDAERIIALVSPKIPAS